MSKKTKKIDLVQKMYQACLAIDPETMQGAEIDSGYAIVARRLVVSLRKAIWAQPVMGRTIAVPDGVRSMHFEAWMGYPKLVIPGHRPIAQWDARPIYPDEEGFGQ